MDRTNISGYIIDLTLHQKELFAYVQYLDETNKATNSAERQVPAFERRECFRRATTKCLTYFSQYSPQFLRKIRIKYTRFIDLGRMPHPI